MGYRDMVDLVFSRRSLFVAGLALLTTLRSSQCLAIMWIQNVTLFGHVEAASQMWEVHWLSKIDLAFEATGTFYVQMFFCRRLWAISRNGYILGICFILYTFGLASAGVDTFFLFLAIESTETTGWGSLHLGVVLCGDLLLTGSTIFYLLKHSNASILSRSPFAIVINSLLRLTVQSAAPSAINSHPVLPARRAEKQGKPSHWVYSEPTDFQNPWPSFRLYTTGDIIFEYIPTAFSTLGSPPKDAVAQIPIQKPTWGWGADGKSVPAENTDKIKATWLGHACFLVELPSSTAGVRGARILFDPVFSDRCSPTQWFGPKRFTPAPCALEDVPEIDAVVISHNHYDHMDTTSLQHLLARTSAPHVFAPLGKRAVLPQPRRPRLPRALPRLHFTGRGLRDRFKSLWGGWVVEAVPSESDPTDAATPARVYFGGDTGYRAVNSSTDDDDADLPVCPAFAEIGDRWGAFDFAMIPIGAYEPRRFMSPIHRAPRDSVGIFRDIRARRALGMHWGAWILTTEDILEPPKLLAAECAKAGVKEGGSGCVRLGRRCALMWVVMRHETEAEAGGGE
ncbi:Zn-dependent hydrolase oxidoreductase family [Mycena sanguinolenta]|uniref:Zn-dependent hydrolase oxidoreductase family n=1 Tax=Mycena sanguinolenta TaxID=230812 RepID=A0A8H6ZGC5_9AGAR|nr:Zn-dependent hydrolase oxidoreductase family [Mycena sanguinolenta]